MIKAIKQYRFNNSAKTATRKTRRGFTLIELVVVIAIILLLLSLVMAVGLSARSQAEKREMQNILLLVDQAIKEWEVVSGRKLSWGTGGIYDLPSDVGPTFQLDRALARIQKVDSVKQILANIDSDFLQQVDNGSNPPTLHLVDPWGEAVCLIHPGSVDNVNSPTEDSDGTIRTAYENVYGLTVNRTLLLVSAGPDGKIGSLLDPDSPEFDQAADNIYSYRPESIE